MTLTKSRWVNYSGLALIGLAAIVFFVSILPSCRSFPYSDEWDYVTPLTSFGSSHLIGWLFEQHVDHRIPLQKALQVSLLELSGFDFRWLVALNFFLACVVAILLMHTAHNYRRQSKLGDLFIPICVLSLGTGFSLWGFEFQFLSSTFFVVLFLYLIVRSELHGRPLQLDLALVALFACTWCGLNGTILSSSLTLVLGVYFFWERSEKLTFRHSSSYIILAMCAVANAIVWISWRPSGASNVQSFNAAATARFFYGLFNSSLVVYAFEGAAWKFSVLALLVSAALWFGYRSIARRTVRWRLTNVAMLGVLCGTILVMLSIAIGRSKYESWNPGLEIHYGVLTILMPIVSWIILSSQVNHRVSAVVGFFLVLIFARAYMANWNWRFGYVSYSRAENQLVREQIATGLSSADITRKYIRDFYFIDNPDARSVVSFGIDTLRKKGGRLYNASSADFTHPQTAQ